MREKNSRLLQWLACLSALHALAGPGHAQELAAGQAKASSACAVCHGPMGMAMQPGVPHLAGQQQMYLVEQLRNYRSGKRQHEVMGVIAKPLSDADIDALSLWYSSIAVRLDSP